MIRATEVRAALFAVVVAAACAAPSPPDQPTGVRPDALQGEDTCGMAAHANLIDVHESAIDRASLPAGARVICATCLVTQDYAPARLNLHLSAQGRVASMRCG